MHVGISMYASMYGYQHNYSFVHWFCHLMQIELPV